MKLTKGEFFKREFIITDSMVKEFSRVTGDNNPVHLDDEYAKTTVFKKRIAPGMLAGGLISSVLGNDFPGIGTIYLSQAMKFTNPVFIDDHITVLIEVMEIKLNNWIKLKTDCSNQNNLVVVRGEAIIIPPDN